MLNPQILPPLREPEPEAPTPAIRVIESTDTYASVALEPLERGFATTVGNPLRRLLLSSIQGTAVTWVKIEDVPHEYSVIPGVKEEVMDLLLSVKRIRIHALAKRPGKMRLDVTGEGRVCAGDISTASDFQIVNPELHLATLDNPDVSLSIEFNVESGKGYQQVAQGDSMAGLPVGVLPVDAIYNPVRKVEYSVERMMVGQQTDWERLVLQVWTDGAVTPLAAIQEASENLVQHFYMFNQLSRPADFPLDTTNLSVASEVYLMPIERLDLSSRTLNCLKRVKLDRVGQVLELTSDDLLNIRNFGQKSLEELQGKLAELGVSSARTAEAVEDLDFAPDSGVLSSGSLIFEPDDDLDYDDDGD
ncbi:MAG: DNA-directed RNA polymerase subunit alpha [Chloroflexi bacterium]|nr:DNA-directed RNA polymerase subunit alpha [Chloroflexota bacterium]MYD47445.1 DNA-directed RNA polymerase subunit alpha [Chloroflexota bacterium]